MRFCMWLSKYLCTSVSETNMFFFKVWPCKFNTNGNSAQFGKTLRLEFDKFKLFSESESLNKGIFVIFNFKKLMSPDLQNYEKGRFFYFELFLPRFVRIFQKLFRERSWKICIFLVYTQMFDLIFKTTK